jgi:hypothetical protein
MVKNEIINAGKLTRLYFTNKAGIIAVSIIFAYLMLFNLVTVVSFMLRGDEGFSYRSVSDYSGGYIFGLIITFIVFNCIYRSENREIAVYPQTNNSRFLAFQLFAHVWIIAIPLALLASYLIQYGIISIVAAIQGNVSLAYQFDTLFLLAGLAVMMIYLAILFGIITLIAVLLRKFWIYAIAFFAALAALAITNLSLARGGLERVFGFLIFESSVWLFILKGVAVWAVLLLAAVIINKHTVYYRVRVNATPKIIISVILGVVLAAVMLFVTFESFNSTETTYITGQTEVAGDRDLGIMGGIMGGGGMGWSIKPHTEEFIFDISHLPDGSGINVELSGDISIIPSIEQVVSSWWSNNKSVIEYEDGTVLEFPLEHILIEYIHELTNTHGDTLSIIYRASDLIVDGIEIKHLTNPVFEARMEGNTLYIHYSSDRNLKVVLIPIWSLMTQFEYFAGRDLVSVNWINTSNSPPRVWLTVS